MGTWFSITALAVASELKTTPPEPLALRVIYGLSVNYGVADPEYGRALLNLSESHYDTAYCDLQATQVFTVIQPYITASHLL
jgi:hypothetical protein